MLMTLKKIGSFTPAYTSWQWDNAPKRTWLHLKTIWSTSTFTWTCRNSTVVSLSDLGNFHQVPLAPRHVTQPMSTRLSQQWSANHHRTKALEVLYSMPGLLEAMLGLKQSPQWYSEDSLQNGWFHHDFSDVSYLPWTTSGKSCRSNSDPYPSVLGCEQQPNCVLRQSMGLTWLDPLTDEISLKILKVKQSSKIVIGWLDANVLFAPHVQPPWRRDK